MNNRNLCAIQVVSACLSMSCAGPVWAADMAPMSMTGSIDNRYAIFLDLKSSGNKVSGSYKYSTSKSSLTLDGTISGAKVVASEKDDKGQVTGTFNGTIVAGKRFFGSWTDSKKTKTLPFIVAVESNPSALDGGKDGIVITHTTKKIAKNKRDGETPEPAVVTIPVVAQKLLPVTIGPKVQKVLSTKNAFEQSPEEMAKEIKDGDFWLSEVDYTINYNKNYLVDADFNRNGCGAYPDGSTSHVLVDLKTGKQVKANDAFNAASIPQLRKLLKARMEKEVQESFKEFEKSPEELTDLKDQLKAPFVPSQALLDNFTVSDKGLTFTQNWSFPHVIQALQPDGLYFFSFAELKTMLNPNGPLGQFAK